MPLSRSAGVFMIAFAALASPAGAQEPPLFERPIACEIGRSCFIQNYYDDDPGPDAKDYQCGALTYDGHDGVDFRVPSIAAARAGVNVLAARDGKVLRLREDAPDRFAGPLDRAAVKDTECGNGMLIEHEDGWQSQYCHMARGSLTVKPGDQVKAGQTLGRVGMSGLTEFPHLHLTIRHNGKTVDPFAYGAAAGSCGGGTSLWSASLRAEFAYARSSIIHAGFSDAPVTVQALLDGFEPPALTTRSPAIVAFITMIGLRKGDTQTLTVIDPSGRTMTESRVVADSNKAQWFMFTGKRRSADWAPGEYRAVYSLRDGDSTVLERRFSVQVTAAQ